MHRVNLAPRVELGVSRFDARRSAVLDKAPEGRGDVDRVSVIIDLARELGRGEGRIAMAFGITERCELPARCAKVNRPHCRSSVKE